MHVGICKACMFECIKLVFLISYENQCSAKNFKTEYTVFMLISYYNNNKLCNFENNGTHIFMWSSAIKT